MAWAGTEMLPADAGVLAYLRRVLHHAQPRGHRLLGGPVAGGRPRWLIEGRRVVVGVLEHVGVQHPDVAVGPPAAVDELG